MVRRLIEGLLQNKGWVKSRGLLANPGGQDRGLYSEAS
jgi:hypothetical protein